MQQTTFSTELRLRVTVTAQTEPRGDGKPPEVIALVRVLTETGADVLGAMSITDRVALAEEAEVAAQIDARPFNPSKLPGMVAAALAAGPIRRRDFADTTEDPTA